MDLKFPLKIKALCGVGLLSLIASEMVVYRITGSLSFQTLMRNVTITSIFLGIAAVIELGKLGKRTTAVYLSFMLGACILRITMFYPDLILEFICAGIVSLTSVGAVYWYRQEPNQKD
jgi:hypothetical protein